MSIIKAPRRITFRKWDNLPRIEEKKVLADIQGFSIAGTTMQGVQVKVEHDLHTSVCKWAFLMLEFDSIQLLHKDKRKRTLA